MDWNLNSTQVLTEASLVRYVLSISSISKLTSQLPIKNDEGGDGVLPPSALRCHRSTSGPMHALHPPCRLHAPEQGSEATAAPPAPCTTGTTAAAALEAVAAWGAVGCGNEAGSTSSPMPPHPPPVSGLVWQWGGARAALLASSTHSPPQSLPSWGAGGTEPRVWLCPHFSSGPFTSLFPLPTTA